MQKSALFILLAMLTAVCFAQSDHVPAYNSGPTKSDQAPILPKDQLWGEAFQYPYQAKAYLLAAKIPGVINQIPCYCYCERMGHTSLHTCFESTHGAHCGICMKEAFLRVRADEAEEDAGPDSSGNYQRRVEGPRSGRSGQER